MKTKKHFKTSTLQRKRQQTRGNKGHAVHYGYENGGRDASAASAKDCRHAQTDRNFSISLAWQ